MLSAVELKKERIKLNKAREAAEGISDAYEREKELLSISAQLKDLNLRDPEYLKNNVQLKVGGRDVKELDALTESRRQELAKESQKSKADRESQLKKENSDQKLRRASQTGRDSKKLDDDIEAKRAALKAEKEAKRLEEKKARLAADREMKARIARARSPIRGDK
eukprot:TRINITY_DN2383_c0_g1_i3.p1 TRINITY_DN2383_c0_g1~~TRINITY_DN2383_c0_g1_i3.p1  ORF type:complete len:165 (+),score=56.87 TRINITY_DN2383_c0_g1_i3:311-805(+)